MLERKMFVLKYFMEAKMEDFMYRDDIANDKATITQVLLRQYDACVSKFQMHDDHIWKIPSVTFTIDSALITLIFTVLNNANDFYQQLASLFVLIVAGFFTLTMIMSLFKNRYFQYNLIQRMNQIEEFFNITKMPMFTLHSNKKGFMNEMAENNRFSWTNLSDVDPKNVKTLLEKITEKKENLEYKVAKSAMEYSKVDYWMGFTLWIIFAVIVIFVVIKFVTVVNIIVDVHGVIPSDPIRIKPPC